MENNINCEKKKEEKENNLENKMKENEEENKIIDNQQKIEYSFKNKIIENNKIIINENKNDKSKKSMNECKINHILEKRINNNKNIINEEKKTLKKNSNEYNEENQTKENQIIENQIIENQIKENKPKNCGHSKMKKIYEEIKSEALEKPKKIKEEDKSQKENENKRISKSNSDNIKNIFINITEDGGIQKMIIKKGIGEITPSEGKEVFIYFKSTYKNKIFDQSLENEPFRFTIGENKVIKGWEIAVKTMKIGEKSKFFMKPEYTYGEKQVKDWIPSNSVLSYEIELIAIGNINSENCLENMTYEEKLHWGKLLKAEGVEKFKKDDIKGANECFLKALSFLKKLDPKKEEEKEGVDLFLTIISNICNCYNKEKEYNSVIEFANLGLEIKLIPKLLYFRAIAFAYNEDFENADNDLNTLSNLLLEATGDEHKYIEQALDYLKYILDKRKKIFIEKNKKYSRAIFRQYLYYDKPLKHKPLLPSKEINPENPIVFFEISIGEKNIGKIEFELFKDIAPKTAENFRCLCIGNNDELTYKGTYLNKIIKNFVIGGGQLKNNNGKKKCIYGEYFDDENYIYCHCRRGLLTMDNEGKNTNNSKFLITLKYLPWLDGKHVVFGQIIEGMEIIKEIEELETDNEDRPLNNIIIENCGEILKKEIFKAKEANIKSNIKKEIIKEEMDEKIKTENEEREEINIKKEKCQEFVSDAKKENEEIKVEKNDDKNNKKNKLEENKERENKEKKEIKIDEKNENKIEEFKECRNKENKRINIEENKNTICKKEENDEIKLDENKELKIEKNQNNNKVENEEFKNEEKKYKNQEHQNK